MDVTSLQGRVTAYHAARFPACAPWEVVFKSMEELGELAEAMQPGGSPDLAAQEAADVVVTLMALCGRFLDADLLDQVARKLAVLTTPGAHRHSLTEVPEWAL